MGATCTADNQAVCEDGQVSVEGVHSVTQGNKMWCQARTRHESVESMEQIAMINDCDLESTTASSSSALPRAVSIRQTFTDDATGSPSKVSEEEWQTMLATMNHVVGVPQEPSSPTTKTEKPRNEELDASDYGTMDADDYFFPAPAVVPIGGNTAVLEGYSEEAGGEESELEEDSPDSDEERIRELDETVAAVRNGKPLYAVPEHLRGDKDVVLAAISNEGSYCVAYINSRELKEEDRDVVLALIFADGSLLANVCPALRGDREIVRAALGTDANAIKFASEELKADKVIKAIVEKRVKEEARLMKIIMAKCGPMPGCLG